MIKAPSIPLQLHYTYNTPESQKVPTKIVENQKKDEKTEIRSTLVVYSSLAEIYFFSQSPKLEVNILDIFTL